MAEHQVSTSIVIVNKKSSSRQQKVLFTSTKVLSRYIPAAIIARILGAGLFGFAHKFNTIVFTCLHIITDGYRRRKQSGRY